MTDTYARVLAAAHSGAFGINELALPTAEQCRAGNYLKGRVIVQRLPLVIEVPQGQRRMGKSDGKPWSTILMAHYGYIAGTKGADGDALDIFVGPVPESQRVWVVNQIDRDGGFDEHKILIGFIDEDSARAAYMNSYERGWTGLGSLIACSIDQLKWWLKYGNTTIPLSDRALPHDGTADMNEILWDSAAEPIGLGMADVVYQLRRTDGEGLMLDAVTLAEIMEDNEGEEVLDALVVEYVKVERKAEQLRKIMVSMGGDVTPVSVQVTPPFKQRGTTNVVILFELSDGQTVSIWFHNPDSTPNRILPNDELVSWSWRLNKKDVSILVAPEKGLDLNPREVARRIMKLAQRNSARFAKANATRAQRMASIEGLKGAVSGKEAALAALDALFADLTEKVEAKRARPPKATLQTNDQLPEGWTESTPGGMATNRDPMNGGIIDKVMLMDEWFVIFERDGIDQIGGLSSRAEAFAAHAKALAAADAAMPVQATYEGRAVAVRAALASLGWDAMASSTISHLNIDGSVYGLKSEYASKGQQVTGLTWTDTGGGPSWVDDLSLSNEDMAAKIDGEFRESIVRARAAALFDPTTPEGYAIATQDEQIQIAHQDELDSFFQGRLIAVRNALRDLGWDGERYKPLTKTASNGDVWTFDPYFKQVGGGANIVEFYPKLTITRDGKLKTDENWATEDRLTLTAVELAALINSVVPGSKAEPAAQTRLEWEELVYEAIEASDITRSDAQAIVEGQGDMIDDLFAAGSTPSDAAAAILAAASGEPVSPEPAPAAVDEQLEEAKALLQKVIDGDVDFLDEGLAARLETIHDDYADEEGVMALFSEAAQAYSDYVIQQARTALA